MYKVCPTLDILWAQAECSPIHKNWPNNKEELATLLEMLNFLAKYIPNLSSQNKDLRDLLKQKEIIWEEKHNEALNAVKKSMVSHLSFFNPTCKTLDLTVDASSHGLGAYI